jgi:hypothetical protein
VTVVDHAGAVELPAGTKAEVAHRILDRVAGLIAPPVTGNPRRRRR